MRPRRSSSAPRRTVSSLPLPPPCPFLREAAFDGSSRELRHGASRAPRSDASRSFRCDRELFEPDLPPRSYSSLRERIHLAERLRGPALEAAPRAASREAFVTIVTPSAPLPSVPGVARGGPPRPRRPRPRWRATSTVDSRGREFSIPFELRPSPLMAFPHPWEPEWTSRPCCGDGPCWSA